MGDENDVVGIGYGKAREVPLAIQKAVENARKSLIRVPKFGQTIPHRIIGRFGAGHVVLRPGGPGTGVIAGGGVRAVLELAGIRDVLSKSIGTQNPINLVRATMEGLMGLRRPEDVSKAARAVGEAGTRAGSSGGGRRSRVAGRRGERTRPKRRSRLPWRLPRSPRPLRGPSPRRRRPPTPEAKLRMSAEVPPNG